ncbi:LysR family transcriptional regulator [Pseudomonas sp. Rh2]|uniref:LysR family transcriptional regulator n=1 Tax=Pseudomonas taiwanensis TaxID=470150 RepID=A0ABR6V6E0_9PSED|nr:MULTISPECIES: LysR family transcriptional regulator [Pseudomonas]AGZ32908.1 LysR family transcriptional regulator [Pseudomonas sp. VLB120]MBC3476068.1 LysR family transcriptional regulator [Pseudomonas taiwanensis]MBC3490553.1 LysR family transcriptional regulator [Pseudomonas taiwanensis]QQZ36407.1 LysR family transcriptional regulator [Pseudomonas sp. SK2]WEZ88738.1 LysR family transcriptional regulator [Pseudomonas sp. NyZ480]
MFEHLAKLSLDALRVFEAAARLRGFTAAATELGTTQPAVSQQVKRLEAQLGARLFDRIYRGIELTEAGQQLFEQVHQGLQTMNEGIGQVSGRGQREVLQVATDFAFAAFWLMPRLQRFHQAYPQVDVSLVTGERSQGMLRPDIDVAILFGDGRFHQGESRWLFDEEVFPVCSPRLIHGKPLSAVALQRLPLLHLRGEQASRWFDWAGVFRGLGVESPAPSGQLRFDNYTLLIQAAIAGQGVAIGWRHLVDGLVEQGLLCRPLEQSLKSSRGYYVVLPPRKRRGALIERFVDWLEQERSGTS